MNPTTLLQFESRLQQKSPLQKLWSECGSTINGGKVESRDKAYILFSHALKISKLAMQDETIKDLWQNLLAQGCFSLCSQDSEPIHYNFTTITELLKAGKDSFEVEVVEVDPKNADLSKMAEGIHTTALSAFGDSPGASFFQTILSSPNTLCLLAQTEETFIGHAYGTYLELPGAKFIHLNNLGRMVEYPSVHILAKLLNETGRIQRRFPHAQYMTLCVRESNEHMLPIYKDLGFKEIERIEAGIHDEPTFFYAKKLDENSSAEPPTYLEYKAALEALRKK